MSVGADLRNAAQLIVAAGKAEGQYIDGRTGATCLDAAVALSTKSSLVTTLEGRFFLHAVPLRLGLSYERYRKATDHLETVLPDRCTADHRFSLGICPFAEVDGRTLRGRSRLHHFNDYVCDGAEEVAAVLVEAAEKWEANQ